MSNNLTPTRRAAVNRYGSPVYTYTPPELAAGASVIINIDAEFPASRKYSPLDTTVISNDSPGPIRVQFNGAGGRNTFVQQGMVVIVRDQAISQLEILNQGGTLAAPVDSINLNLSRAATTVDALARRGQIGR